MSDGNDEERTRAIYDQDCEFYRYQDGLMWSRFQTAAVVEGALLYAVYGDQLTLSVCERILLSLAGALLVFVLCMLSLKDNSDADRHIRRIRDFETRAKLRLPLPVPGFWVSKGSQLMTAGIVVVNAVNLILLVLLFFRRAGEPVPQNFYPHF